ncbi:flavodoxin domain-containing protein [Bacillus suaedaesalsae]|uniref:Flavodoxin domain-containing protein n=1 Tax=Bacillus suaedaesalsae TaxID=2810349 RepID=A0ABS2DDP0_9BACI|nr:flavodoxin domain-containing protein [Bacillus suaedaesalsae]MBM6616581.1 flavodoxin domain-containing protein [Bacillus suaedaesalsae]
MVLMNFNEPKISIVYTSITGNTEKLATSIYSIFIEKGLDASLNSIDQFNIESLRQRDVVIIGTYTWGNGAIPKEMNALYSKIEILNQSDMVTGVFGTGDRFYPNFCGAVDFFRDMLFQHTRLAATLKVELLPQASDIQRCSKFVEAILYKLNNK